MPDSSAERIPGRQAPGPANGPFGFRHIYSMNTRPLEFYQRLGGFGDIATFRMFGVRAFLVNSPDLIHQVLRDTGTRFRKLPRMMKVLTRGLGRGLLVAEGEDWLTARRLVQGAFRKDTLRGLMEQSVPCVEDLLDRWSRERQLELFTEMNRLTVDLAARGLLGVELAETREIGAAARELADSWAQSSRQVWCLPSWLPFHRQRRERAALAYLRSVIARVIDQRQAGGGSRTDLVSRLIAGYAQAPGTVIEQREALIDQVLTLFIAAYHASTVTLCWTFYLLAGHPEVQDRVVEEIEQVIGGRELELADFEELPLLEHVLKESMRMYPSAWELFPREAVAATDLGPWRIPSGAWLLLSPYVTHRDSRFFADPLTFDPDRWSAGRIKAIDPHAYFPFGGGRHLCVGRDLAMSQNLLILAMVLRQFRFRFLQTSHTPDHLPPLALVPRDPMWVKLEPQAVLQVSS